VALERLDGDLPARRQDPQREREVEARPHLAQIGGSKVGRYPLLGELEARVLDRGPHALARLADGGVAQPDDRERGQPRPQVDLHGHPPGVEAVDRERADAGEHDSTLGGTGRPAPVARRRV
jgi:hypothetical protein